MKALAAVLEGLGARSVKTYIQSGNAVFVSPEEDNSRLAAKISSEIKKVPRFEPHVLLLELEDIERAIRQSVPRSGNRPKNFARGISFYRTGKAKPGKA